MEHLHIFKHLFDKQLGHANISSNDNLPSVPFQQSNVSCCLYAHPVFVRGFRKAYIQGNLQLHIKEKCFKRMYSSANHESCFALKIVIINGIHFNIFGGGLISRGERRANQK